MPKTRSKSRAMLSRAASQLPLVQMVNADRAARLQSAQGSELAEETKRKEAIAIKPTWPEFARKTQIRSGRKLIPFDPYHYQVAFVEQVEKHYGTVAVKSRQMGFTEMVASFFLWSAFMDPGYLAVIFSKNQQDTRNIAKRVRMMAATHPDIILETENLEDLKLADGGRLLFKPATPHSARGLESVAAILFDEAAFVAGIEEIYSAALPATEMLGDDARIIILSTPNGQSGFYWDRVNESNGDRNILDVCNDVRMGGDPVQHWTDEQGWCKFLAHWKGHPVYSNRENYLETLTTQKRMPESKIKQEYDLDFTVAGTSLFNIEAVQRQAVGAWAEPQNGRRYLMGVDPNFGGSDFFRAQVWDITEEPSSLVAEYGENQKGIEYSKLKLLGLIDRYKPVLCAVESNSGGVVLLEDLVKERRGTKFEAVNTSHTSKRVNTDRIAISIEQGEVIYPKDWDGIGEMMRFDALSREARSGNDDSVMAFAVAWACKDSAVPSFGWGTGRARYGS